MPKSLFERMSEAQDQRLCRNRCGLTVTSGGPLCANCRVGYLSIERLARALARAVSPSP